MFCFMCVVTASIGHEVCFHTLQPEADPCAIYNACYVAEEMVWDSSARFLSSLEAGKMRAVDSLLWWWPGSSRL